MSHTKSSAVVRGLARHARYSTASAGVGGLVFPGSGQRAVAPCSQIYVAAGQVRVPTSVSLIRIDPARLTGSGRS